MFLFYLFLHIDVFQAGLWSQRFQLLSNKLKGLADSLPTFVLCSKATSSNVKYKNAWLNWKKWEKDNVGYNQFPVSPFLFCLYLREKVESSNSPAPVEAAFYAVRWAHEIAGASSPTESSLVKQVLEASKRLLGKPVQGKQSVDVDLVTKVAEKFNTPQASISNLRTCFIFIIAFAGLMGCDEVIHINRSHISIFSDHMSIFCPKRKNDQRSQGHFFYFARSGKITCPVSITEKMLSKLPDNPVQPLVCRLSSKGSALQHSISYSRVREIFRETIKIFVKDVDRYGTHSLKKGGATASNAAGISGEFLDRHAGWAWKSAKSKDSYINVTTKDKLMVPRAINL